MTTTPQLVTLTGPRMSGTIPVRFQRASNWARTIVLGDATFGTDNHVAINGVNCTLAGLCLIENNDTWQPTSHGFLRRAGSHEPATPTAMKAAREWAITTAAELAARHPYAFDETPLGPVTDTDWREAHHRAVDTADICAAFATVHAAIAAGHTTTAPTSDVGPIRWNTPRIDGLVTAKAAAEQPADVVATVSHNNEPIAYVVDVRRNPRAATPDPTGGLIVPIDIVNRPPQ